MEEAPAGYLTAEQACQQLNLSPQTFRQLLREYRDVLPDPETTRGRLLRHDDVRRLATIARLRAEGADAGRIRAALLAGHEAPAAEVPAEAPVHAAPVWSAALERLDRIEQAVRDLDRQRREDRDRMMVLLVRLQQEMQLLRYELANLKGRRRGSAPVAG